MPSLNPPPIWPVAGNPYIVGTALDAEFGFFGRQDILDFVAKEMTSENRSSVVLSGQRRIGKTSILLQLERRLPKDQFLPIYFDLMPWTRKPLGRLLAEVAAETASKVPEFAVDLTKFDDEGVYFKTRFLPALYDRLPRRQRPILLFDEFDVFDEPIGNTLSNTAAQALFPYLDSLMGRGRRMGFVFVIGRRPDQLTMDAKALFRSALARRVSVLDETSARSLIQMAEAAGTLCLTPDSIERILALTSGHPYCIQILCYYLWERAYRQQGGLATLLSPKEVNEVVPSALEGGNQAFEWIWEGLPPPERVIAATIAAATPGGKSVSEEELIGLLQQHGILIWFHELRLAPSMLVKWELLLQTEKGYSFFVELFRQWIVLHRPLKHVKDDLDRMFPSADQKYQDGMRFFHESRITEAIARLQNALDLNPKHFKARFLLGECWLRQGDYNLALTELRKVYSFDQEQVLYRLIEALLLDGKAKQELQDIEGALQSYEEILGYQSHHLEAQERIARIWFHQATEAIEKQDFSRAHSLLTRVSQINSLSALPEKLQEQLQDQTRAVTEQLRKQYLHELAAKAKRAEDHELWADALRCYKELQKEASQDSDEQGEAEWSARAQHVKRFADIVDHYEHARQAYQSAIWPDALRHLAEVLVVQPDYRDAAVLANRAVDALARSQGVSDLARMEQEFRNLISERDALARQSNTIKDALEQQCGVLAKEKSVLLHERDTVSNELSKLKPTQIQLEREKVELQKELEDLKGQLGNKNREMNLKLKRAQITSRFLKFWGVALTVFAGLLVSMIWVLPIGRAVPCPKCPDCSAPPPLPTSSQSLDLALPTSVNRHKPVCPPARCPAPEPCAPPSDLAGLRCEPAPEQPPFNN